MTLLNKILPTTCIFSADIDKPMHDWQSYAAKHGIALQDTGSCQFCRAPVSGGVAECHQNASYS